MSDTALFQVLTKILLPISIASTPLPSPFVDRLATLPTQSSTGPSETASQIDRARSGRALPFAISFWPALKASLPLATAAMNARSPGGILIVGAGAGVGAAATTVCAATG